MAFSELSGEQVNPEANICAAEIAAQDLVASDDIDAIFAHNPHTLTPAQRNQYVDRQRIVLQAAQKLVFKHSDSSEHVIID